MSGAAYGISLRTQTSVRMKTAGGSVDEARPAKFDPGRVTPLSDGGNLRPTNGYLLPLRPDHCVAVKSRHHLDLFTPEIP
jgi:hypothetical protein